MTKILDQYGNPIDRRELTEPQTSRIGALQNQYLEPMLGGLTPAKLARVLRAADNGDLLEQHRLFSDMEERDGHLRAEMDKRKNAVASVSWDVVPPNNPSAAELAATAWVKEMLQDAVDPLEDMLLAMMEAVGHGFAAVELEWNLEDGQLLPGFHPRPQEWFRLNQARTALHLSDSSADGAALRPFGWVMHTHGKAKTGYLGRMGLFRTLVWPFLYKAYSLGDLAEFLETYGLPIIVGKYFSGASPDEKASLLRAVTALGHDARAIMPEGMSIEINEVAAAGGASAHLAMVEWAEKSESKSILGQTLSADTGSDGGGSYALGKVHNEVRHDIMRGDSRQVAATLTRDLVFPMVRLNRPDITSLKRSPRLILDIGQAEDIKVLSESLPRLVAVGMRIPQTWAHEKLHIPLAKDGEAVLATGNPTPSPAAQPDVAAPAALSAAVPVAPVAAATADPVAGAALQLAVASAPAWSGLIDQVKAMVDQAADLTALQRDLVDTFGGQPGEALVQLMAAALALAQLKGMSDVLDGR